MNSNEMRVETRVSTPCGHGTISYVEEGYIEVDVGGTEHGFDYPFSTIKSSESDCPRRKTFTSDSELALASMKEKS